MIDVPQKVSYDYNKVKISTYDSKLGKVNNRLWKRLY